MTSSLVTIGAVKLAPLLSNIPPTGALFSAFLSYNPVDSILSSLAPSVVATYLQQPKPRLLGPHGSHQHLQMHLCPPLKYHSMLEQPSVHYLLYYRHFVEEHIYMGWMNLKLNLKQILKTKKYHEISKICKDHS